MKKLYIVYVHITPDGMYYYGVTSQKVERRWRDNGRYYKGTSLQPYIEKYGWNNIQHIVLFENQSKEDALLIEDSLITTAQEDGVCINKKRSGNISKEEGYFQQYREQNKEQIKQYYEQNKEQILERQKKYQDEHKDKIRKYRREYKEKNRDKINEYRRQRYQKNRDKILEQNRDKRLEYQRQYRQRKKLEKQLKEVEITPLF